MPSRTYLDNTSNTLVAAQHSIVRVLAGVPLGIVYSPVTTPPSRRDGTPIKGVNNGHHVVMSHHLTLNKVTCAANVAMSSSIAKMPYAIEGDCVQCLLSNLPCGKYG